MDAEQHALLWKINRRLSGFVENGEAKTIRVSGLDGPLGALVDTVNRLVTRARDHDRALPERDFVEAGVSELARARRYRRQLSVLAVQLDRYEATLAEHGDAVAAEVRSTATRVLDGVLRESDPFGQRSELGFGVVLPETEVDLAAEVGERLRAAFEAEDVFTGDELVLFTVSIGVAGASETKESFEAIYRRATEAMHQASQVGGNRVKTG